MADAAAKPPVAFIGLGAMGFGMATHLVKQGYAVTGFDVWGPTLERFAAAGGATATTPAAAVADKPVVVCMVATAQQAQDVLLDGDAPAVPALPRGAVVLLCSTVPCAYVQALHAALEAAGRPDVHLVDAPVSGGATRAADGTLSIMAGAADDALAAARPLLAELADPAKLYVVAGGVGAGSNMKMVHQVLAACQILSASEAMGLAAHLGLDARRAHDAIVASDGWSWMFGHRAPRMLTAFQPVASALAIIVKDTSIITAEARRAAFPALLTGAAENVYFAAMGRGFAADDDSGVLRLYTEGLGPAGAAPSGDDDDDDKIALVVDLLRGIHLCAAAESLAFAHRVGLDLDQVLDLCINAAGGSRMLEAHGPAIVRAFKEGGAARAWPPTSGEDDLVAVKQRLQAAVQEAQRLKVPTYLGSLALNLVNLALRSGDGAAGSVVRVWAQ